MPLLKTSIKSNNQNIKNRARNAYTKKMLKGSIKDVLDNVEKGAIKEAEGFMSMAFSRIDRAIKKNVIKKNTGARKKALLHRVLKNAGSKVSQFTPLVKKTATKAAPAKASAKAVKKSTSKKTVKKSK